MRPASKMQSIPEKWKIKGDIWIKYCKTHRSRGKAGSLERGTLNIVIKQKGLDRAASVPFSPITGHTVTACHPEYFMCEY